MINEAQTYPTDAIFLTFDFQGRKMSEFHVLSLE